MRRNGAKKQREDMIEKVRDERSETAIKLIHSSMEELNKQMLEMMKRIRVSGDTKRTYMSVTTMYLTQVMDKDKPAWRKLSIVWYRRR